MPRIFPSVYKLLAYTNEHYPDTRLENAVVENGLLIISTRIAVVKIDLHLYFSKAEIKYAEGKVFSVDLLEAMSKQNLTSLELSMEGVNFVTIKGKEGFYYYAGRRIGDQSYETQSIIDESPEDAFVFPSYKTLFDNFRAKAYPNVGLNLATLPLIAGCFKQSLSGKDAGLLKLTFPECPRNFQPDYNWKPLLIKPIKPYDSAVPEAEIAVFTVSEIPGLNEMENLI